MNKLSLQQRVQVLAALVEGNSIRATVRMTNVSKPTILKLLADVGKASMDYQDKTLKNIKSKRIQCDEIWSFVHAKQKNLPKKLQHKTGFGDVWTWTALDADSKLMVSWMIGNRDLHTARLFIKDLASRLANRVQLTTDGHKVYLQAVEDAFGSEIDYSMLIKMYGNDPYAGNVKYSPGEVVGIETIAITGRPNPGNISTSYVERQNLTMRMSMRRFTRLTNGFSKKMENLCHAVALHFMHYNFCRIHQTLRVTPAMEAGITEKLWTLEDVAKLADQT